MTHRVSVVVPSFNNANFIEVTMDSIMAQVAAMDANPSVVLGAAQRDLIDARGGLVTTRRGLAGLAGRVPGRAAARHTVVAGSSIFGEPASVRRLVGRRMHASTSA